jgi:hypothetical protein
MKPTTRWEGFQTITPDNLQGTGTSVGVGRADWHRGRYEKLPEPEWRGNWAGGLAGPEHVSSTRSTRLGNPFNEKHRSARGEATTANRRKSLLKSIIRLAYLSPFDLLTGDDLVRQWHLGDRWGPPFSWGKLK